MTAFPPLTSSPWWVGDKGLVPITTEDGSVRRWHFCHSLNDGKMSRWLGEWDVPSAPQSMGRTRHLEVCREAAMSKLP